jgi:hypothetical protein
MLSTPAAMTMSSRHAFRQPRGEDGVAGDVGRLLTHLSDAAHDDVFDQGWIDACAVHQGVENAPREVGGVPTGQLAALATSGGASGGDDIGFGHDGSPWLL